MTHSSPRMPLGEDRHPAASGRPAVDSWSVLDQAPQMICLLQKPRHVIVFANAALRNALGEVDLLGSTLAASPLAAWPELSEHLDRLRGEGGQANLRKLPLDLHP